MNKPHRAAIVCASAALAILVHVLAWFWPIGFGVKPLPVLISDPIGGGVAVGDADPNKEAKVLEKPEGENGDVQVGTDAPSGVLLTIDWPDREAVEQACTRLGLRVVGLRKVDGKLSYAGEIRFDGGLHLAKLDSDLEGFSNKVRRLPRGLFEPLLSNERLDGAVLLLPTKVESDFRAVVDRALADAGLSKDGPACAYGRVLSEPGFEPRLVVQRVEATVATKRG